MMKKRIKRAGASVLIAALAFSAFVIPKSMAAISIDTEADCSIEINVGKNAGNSYSELNVVPVTINLYKVATVDQSGDYTPVAGYETLNLAVDSDTTASEWAQIAADAKTLIDAEGSGLEAVKTVATDKGSVEIEGLDTGLYLIDAQQTLSDYYQYDFTPYLISLPNNYYTTIGSDAWVYDLVDDNAIGLKPLKTERLGDLVIEKFLDVYNATNEGATFVFQIEGTKTDVDTQEERVVYSDVISMTFGAPGTDRYVIEDLPAGSVMTVTEVYSGGSYKLTSDGVDTVVIVADGEEGAPVEVEFSNTYDDRHNGGNGVVNHFSYDSENDRWTHSATEDSTLEQ